MVLSGPQVAKRAFIKLILALAASYTVSVLLTRESTDSQVVSAFRRLVKRAHPDKGGRTEDVQRLNSAKEEWEKASRAKALYPDQNQTYTPMWICKKGPCVKVPESTPPLQ